MLIFIVSIVSILFAAYTFFEVSAIYARIAASLIKKNAIGATIEKMTHTIKRIAVFSYPPALGALHVLDRGEYVFIAAYSALASSAIVIFLTYIFRVRSIKVFLVLINAVMRDSKTSKSLFNQFATATAHRPIKFTSRQSPFFAARSVDLKMVIFSAVIYSAYGGSIFFINMLVLFLPSYEAIIFQLLGLVNGIGTLILAFLLDPIISRKLETGKRLTTISNSFTFGILIGFSVILPTCFVIIHVLYNSVQ